MKDTLYYITTVHIHTVHCDGFTLLFNITLSLNSSHKTPELGLIFFSFFHVFQNNFDVSDELEKFRLGVRMDVEPADCVERCVRCAPSGRSCGIGVAGTLNLLFEALSVNQHFG